MSLKLVKNAHLENDDSDKNILKIRHYETVIFVIHTVDSEAIVLKDCSVTSNKQIRYAIEFFKPTKIQENFVMEKWQYSGELQN